MQQSTSDSGRRRSGGGGGGASLTRASAGRLASGPCLRRCEDGRGRLRQAGDHHVHDGSDYPVRGVCAKRLSSNLTTYRLETACTTTRTLPECNCHCFPCLLCVPRLETCTLGCPPRGASSALRDTDLFIFWGAYCLWFVPLLRMFRGTAGWRRACACARDTDEASTRAHTAHRPTRSTLRETRGASHVKTKAARRGVRACGSARGRGRCGCRGACSSSSPQSARHTNGAGTSICVSCREPSCVVVEGGRKGFPRFCFAVCPPPPHLRCFRANGSEVDSPR